MPYTLSGLEDKVAVVTGAGRMRSIGRPIAVELARAGCDIVLTGTGRVARPLPRRREGGRLARHRLGGRRGPGPRPAGADRWCPTCPTSTPWRRWRPGDRRVRPRRHRRQQRRRRPRARTASRSSTSTRTLWRTVIDVNLTGSFLMSKVFGRSWSTPGRGGSIVNISSIAGKRLQPEHRRLRRVQGRAAGAHRVHGPGGRARTASGSTPSAPASSTPPAWTTSAGARCGSSSSTTRIPLGRAGTGDDIAHAVVYLCSDQGAWVTGQSWNVDGGTVVQH